MPVERPFIRNVWVKIDPPIDPDTKQPFTGRAFSTEIFSDGSRDTLRVGFSIHKSKIYIATPTTVTLYNLKSDTRNEIGKPVVKADGRRIYAQISILVGWQNFGPYEIYRGQVMNTYSTRRGSDIITTVVCLSGLTEIIGSVISKTFTETNTLGSILNQLADKMGLNISRISDSVSNQKIGFKGISFGGRTKDWLDKLAGEYGFSWSILDGQLQILADRENFGQKSFTTGASISAKNGTLFGLMPLLSGPMQLQTGVEINALLIPNVLPGDQVKVESEINPQGQLWYEVHNVTYNGDTGGSEWNMCIQSFRTGL